MNGLVGVAGLLTVVVILETPEERAVAFLSREVPRWPAENRCFSCHNNGDAARRGLAVPSESLGGTTEWLLRPRRWDENRGDPRFSDLALARIQFASALVSATEAGFAAGAEAALVEAAELVVEHQKTDGSWRLDPGGSIGSPATYGTALATWAALRALRGARPTRFEPAVQRAEKWLRQLEVKTVLDAGAVLLALEQATDEDARHQRPDDRRGGSATREAPRASARSPCGSNAWEVRFRSRSPFPRALSTAASGQRPRKKQSQARLV